MRKRPGTSRSRSPSPAPKSARLYTCGETESACGDISERRSSGIQVLLRAGVASPTNDERRSAIQQLVLAAVSGSAQLISMLRRAVGAIATVPMTVASAVAIVSNTCATCASHTATTHTVIQDTPPTTCEATDTAEAIPEARESSTTDMTVAIYRTPMVDSVHVGTSTEAIETACRAVPECASVPLVQQFRNETFEIYDSSSSTSGLVLNI